MFKMDIRTFGNNYRAARLFNSTKHELGFEKKGEVSLATLVLTVPTKDKQNSTNLSYCAVNKLNLVVLLSVFTKIISSTGKIFAQ